MKVNDKLFLVGLIATFLITYFMHQPRRLYDDQEGKEYARKRIEEAFPDTSYRAFYEQTGETQTLVTSAEVAMKVVEPIVLAKYGSETISFERPFQAFKVDNFWLVKGTFPDDPDLRGGTFEVILDARDARVIRIVHYK